MRGGFLGASVGVLGTGVPRLACLRPAAWIKRGPSTAHLHEHKTQDPREGTSLAGRMTWGFLRHGLVRLDHEEAEKSRRGTSRGACDASHDDSGRQAGASPRSVLLSSLVQRGASAAAEYRGIRQRLPFRCNETMTRRTTRWRSPWSPRRRHHQSFAQAKTTFVRIADTCCPLSN